MLDIDINYDPNDTDIADWTNEMGDKWMISPILIPKTLWLIRTLFVRLQTLTEISCSLQLKTT